jgi:hypothetical protein
MLSFSTSYWHFIKFPYFAGATESGDRGWKQAQREYHFTQGDFTNNFNVLNITVWSLESWYGTGPYIQCVDSLW